MTTTIIKTHADATAAKLTEKFDSLFPKWTTIVATLLAVLILLLVLTKLFYKPVRNMVDERRKFIQNNIDEAIKQNQLASEDREKANEELLEAHTVAAKIVQDAKLKSEKLRENNLARAKDEVNRIVQQAHIEAEREKELFETQAREEMIQMALTAAKKVIEKEVNTATNRKFVRDFVKDYWSEKESHKDN